MTPQKALLPALLSLFLALPGRTCTFCEPSQPLPEALPEAPFDMRMPAAFTPDEERDFLADQKGRFARLGAHFADQKPADPARHLLTQEDAEAYLKGRSEARWQRLAQRHRQKQITPQDRKEALLLYWYRGPLLSADQRAFLAALNPAALKAPAKPEGGSGAAAAAGGDAGKAAVDPQLLKDFLAHLELLNHGNAAEAVALEQTASRLLASPTARAFARRLIASGEKVTVSFETVENSEIVMRDGKKVMTGSGGNTSLGPPIHVRLNKNYLAADPSVRSADLPGTLGHELLGHGLGNAEARKSHVEGPYQIYQDNETEAGLVGWVVEAELGGKLENGHLWNYLRDPEEYARSLKMNLPYYAGTFTPAEMADPIPVLKARLKRAEAEKSGLAIARSNNLEWQSIIAHFIKVHGLKKEAFTSLQESTDNQLKVYIPMQEKDLTEIAAYVQQRIDYYETAAGKKAVTEMQAAAKKPFFTQSQKDIADLTTTLRSLAKGHEAEAAGPAPPAGQVTWTQLRALLAADRKNNPDHWKKP